MRGSRGLIASNVTTKKYQAIWRMSPRTRRNCQCASAWRAYMVGSGPAAEEPGAGAGSPSPSL
eukprot:91002-Hanusia_phi.AAC.1